MSPFQRLARVHAASAATDAVIAVALAGSIFFSISPDAARTKVALYLLLTMAPFAVVTPLIGPVIDGLAGGRRAMIFVTMIGRCILAALMIKHIETLWLFPEAFTLLVLQKGYAVAKSAVVPHYVPTESDFVQANSRLALLSAVMSLVGAGIGAAFVWGGGPSWAAAVAVVGYGFATAVTIRLPVISEDSAPSRAEVISVPVSVRHPSAILLAASSMAVLRGTVGLVTFMMAFELRGGSEGVDVSGMGSAVGAAVGAIRDIDLDAYFANIVGEPGAPPWHFAVVAAAAGISAFIGVRLAPVLRRRFGEEMILLGSLVIGFVAAVVASLSSGISGLAVLAAGVSISSSAGKLAFDSLVQRDAPSGNHGRFFAKFEARFQIAWVIGAFVPVMISVPTRVGGLIVAVGLCFALVSFVLGRRTALKLKTRPSRPQIR